MFLLFALVFAADTEFKVHLNNERFGSTNFQLTPHGVVLVRHRGSVHGDEVVGYDLKTKVDFRLRVFDGYSLNKFSYIASHDFYAVCAFRKESDGQRRWSVFLYDVGPIGRKDDQKGEYRLKSQSKVFWPVGRVFEMNGDTPDYEVQYLQIISVGDRTFVNRFNGYNHDEPLLQEMAVFSEGYDLEFRPEGPAFSYMYERDDLLSGYHFRWIAPEPSGTGLIVVDELLNQASVFREQMVEIDGKVFYKKDRIPRYPSLPRWVNPQNLRQFFQKTSSDFEKKVLEGGTSDINQIKEEFRRRVYYGVSHLTGYHPFGSDYLVAYETPNRYHKAYSDLFDETQARNDVPYFELFLQRVNSNFDPLGPPLTLPGMFYIGVFNGEVYVFDPSNPGRLKSFGLESFQ